MADIEMHEDFGRWYGTVSMADADELQARWAGVVRASQESGSNEVEDLVRVAFGSKQQPSAEGLAKLQGWLSSDATSGTKALQVLSAAVLVRMFEDFAIPSLAVVTTACGGARKPDLPMDLVGLAQNDLSAWSANSEERPDIPRRQPTAVGFKFSQEQLNEEGGELKAFEVLRKAVETVTTQLNSRLNEATKALEDRISKTDEELELLWWLVGARSLELDQPFEKVDAAVKPIAFARELADRTASEPGPPAVQALLARAGVKNSGRLRIAEAVNAMSDAWIASTSTGQASAVTAPIHHALVRRGETGPGDAWIAGWSAVTAIPADHAVGPLELAMLFYHERVLLRSLGHLG